LFDLGKEINYKYQICTYTFYHMKTLRIRIKFHLFKSLRMQANPFAEADIRILSFSNFIKPKIRCFIEANVKNKGVYYKCLSTDLKYLDILLIQFLYYLLLLIEKFILRYNFRWAEVFCVFFSVFHFKNFLNLAYWSSCI
jgi:hypothetical protein